MRIGIDIRTLMDRRYSGVSNFTIELVNELLRQDTNNQYILFYNSGQDVSDKIPAFNFGNARMVATRYPNKIFNYVMQKIWHKPLLDQMLGVDVFFMPHINFVALSKQSRKIITIHDLSFLRYYNFFSIRKNIWHKLIAIKKLLLQFDVIVAVSENTKRDLMELLNIAEEKIIVIYSGLNRNAIFDNDEAKIEFVKNKYGLPDSYFLFLGNLEPRKNIENVIVAYDKFVDTYPKYSDYGLVLAGDRGWRYDSIFSTLKRSRNKNKINLVGYVDDQDKSVFYQQAKIFLFPSFYEGFGFPVLEAMANGTPVITSANSSLPEIAQNAAIFVNPYNTNEMTTAIHSTLEDNNLTSRMISESLRIREKFDWSNTAKDYLKLFTYFN